jgi:hypothetical protein
MAIYLRDPVARKAGEAAVVPATRERRGTPVPASEGAPSVLG